MLTVEIRSERGEIIEYIGAGSLFDVWVDLDRGQYPMLAALDPWGNTIFNPRQCGWLVEELNALLPLATRPEEVATIEAVIAMAQTVSKAIHTYLWFVGD